MCGVIWTSPLPQVQTAASGVGCANLRAQRPLGEAAWTQDKDAFGKFGQGFLPPFLVFVAIGGFLGWQLMKKDDPTAGR